MTVPKGNKMLNHINCRVRVTMVDSRTFVGVFKAFDKHMNVILAECEEFRRISGKKGREDREEKRTMGLVLLRGETIVTMTVEGPPPYEREGPRIGYGQGGPGLGRPAGRGMPGPSGGLQGPMRGMGGPSPHMMQPVAQSGPQMSMPPHGMPSYGMPSHMGRGGPMGGPPGGRPY